MGSDHNRIRRKWQDYGGTNASLAETSFYNCFDKVFNETKYEIIQKPKDFQHLYVDVQLSDDVLSTIYNPTEPIMRHGVCPDYAIRSRSSGKTIYVEVKRQDGWVEGGKRTDGRGNAHERSCKFFTPGLLSALREKGKIEPPALPIWTVFQGDIARDPCRVREVTCWYTGYEGHFFFWRSAPNPDLLFAHFDEFIAPLLESNQFS
jgi:hypothetical protein